MLPDRCEIPCIHEYAVQEVRAKVLEPATYSAMAEIFKLLGQPTRLRILHALSVQELCVCDIAALLGASQTAVSHQLRLLRDGRLVTARRNGQMLFYSLADDHIRSVLAAAVDHARDQ